MAKEQAYCFPGNKVMIFTVENEGQPNETAAFRMIDIDDDWRQLAIKSVPETYLLIKGKKILLTRNVEEKN